MSQGLQKEVKENVREIQKITGEKLPELSKDTNFNSKTSKHLKQDK